MMRIWRHADKGEIVRVWPAVVRLTCKHAEACYLRKSRARHGSVGIDPGSKTSGICVVVDHKVVWAAEVEHRSASIHAAMARRAMFRKSRRGRRSKKQRLRGHPPKEARYRHRTRKVGWLPPSVSHRRDSVVRWVRYIEEYLRAMCASVSAAVEVSAFDAHMAVNPDVTGAGYQRGSLWGTNLRAFVLTRDRGLCVYCTSNEVSELDHVRCQSAGGPDLHWNLVASCHRCNKAKGSLPVDVWLAGETRKEVLARAPQALQYVRDLASGKVKLHHLAAANIVAPALRDALRFDGWSVSETVGSVTSVRRRSLELDKAHWVDAACVASPQGALVFRCTEPLSIRMIGRGRRLVVQRDSFGFPRTRKDGSPVASHRSTPPHGIRPGDIVRIDKPGFGKRRRIGTVTTARWDGRCVVKIGRREPLNIMASRLAVIQRSLGAHIQ